MDWRLQRGVGKQQSLCSLQTAIQSPAAQRRMSKQRSMPSSVSVNLAESAGDNTVRDSRVTLAKSSSCRSATAASTPKRTPPSSLTTEITIDIADDDDDDHVTMTSQAGATSRRPVVRNSSTVSCRQTLDVYYGTEMRWTAADDLPLWYRSNC